MVADRQVPVIATTEVAVPAGHSRGAIEVDRVSIRFPDRSVRLRRRLVGERRRRFLHGPPLSAPGRPTLISFIYWRTLESGGEPSRRTAGPRRGRSRPKEVTMRAVPANGRKATPGRRTAFNAAPRPPHRHQ